MSSKQIPLFTGCATALVTPFLPDGRLDEAALKRLISIQLAAGIDALVLLGTTGEPCTLSMEEREHIIQITMREVNGQIPVLVGTGSNDTRKSIEYARQAQRLGAQGQLCVTPYYNKTTQNGLIRHYQTILEHCELPMVLYHVPGRTGMRMEPKTLAQLAGHPQIVGLKEASGDVSLAEAYLECTHGTLPLYSGNDDLTVPLMSIGARGVISVCSNLLPLPMLRITRACLSRRYDEAAAAQQMLLPLIHALFAQVNPIPVKAALSMMGCMHDAVRLPLLTLDAQEKGELRKLLEEYGLVMPEKA